MQINRSKNNRKREQLRDARRGSPATRIALAIVAILTATAIGVGIGAILTQPQPPEALGGEQPSGSVPVASEAFQDPVPVEISVTSGTELPIAPATSGKVTATSCAAGNQLVSGASSFSLDGKPLLNLYTSTPLYRPLRTGDRGDDVRALQEELRRLGHEIDADGEIGERSLRALRERFEALGDDIPGEQIPWERIMWIPRPETEVQRCEVPLGGGASADSPLATASDVPAGASIKPATPPLVEGARQITLDGSALDVPAELRITDPAVLERIIASPSYQSAAATAEKGTVKLTASMTLREPIQVAVVPPAAIVGIDGNRGCIIGDGQPMPVTIVGSRLGQSFVDTGKSHPDEVQANPDPATRCESSGE